MTQLRRGLVALLAVFAMAACDSSSGGGGTDTATGTDTGVTQDVSIGTDTGTPDTCTSDEQCKNLQVEACQVAVCSAGACVAQTAEDGTVCGENQHCEAGECVADVVECDPACAEGFTCENGQCVEIVCDPACDAAMCMECQNGECVSTCGEGFECEAGACVPVEIVCDPACGDGFECVDGNCVEIACDPACDAAMCMECQGGECVSTCGDGETCTDGACVPDVVECDPTCGPCETCTDGTCVSDCTDGQICVDGACVDEGVCDPACDAALCQACVDGACVDTCGDGYTCTDGACVMDPIVCDPACGPCETCTDGACVSDCTDGQICVDGACVDEGVCDPACDAALCQACVDGACVDTCGDGYSCVEGVCEMDVVECDPACGPCETCTDGTCVSDCTDGEICVEGACVPDVVECDPACDEGYECVEGTCVPMGDPCQGVTNEGCCYDNVVLFCEGGELKSFDCNASPNCGWRADEGYYDCGTEGMAEETGEFPMECPALACPTTCEEAGMQCGRTIEGCPWLDCGTCDDGYACVEGMCEIDACGDINPEGCCLGDTLVQCANNEVLNLDCTADGSGNVCGWYTGDDSYPQGFYCGGADLFTDPPAEIDATCGFDCGTTCADQGFTCGLNPACPAEDCGTCETGDICTDNVCVECVVECGDAECGPSNCPGIDCGSCGTGSYCDAGTCADLPNTPITCDSEVSGTTADGVSINDVYGCVGWDETGLEVYYSFTAPADDTITVAFEAPEGDLDLWLLDSTGAASSCLIHGDNGLTFDVTAGTTYYLVLDGYQGAVSSYTMTLDCASVCADPQCDDRVCGQAPGPMCAGYECGAGCADGENCAEDGSACLFDACLGVSGAGCCDPVANTNAFCTADGLVIQPCDEGDICGWYEGDFFTPAGYYCGGADTVGGEDPSGENPIECDIAECDNAAVCADYGYECGVGCPGESCGECADGYACINHQCEEISGQTCDTPGTIACGDTVQGDTTGAFNLIESYAACTSLGEGGPEDVYMIEVTEEQRALTITLSNLNADLDLFLTSDCGNPDACLAHSAGTSDETIEFEVPMAGVYYIIVDGYGDAASSYDLSVECAGPCQADCGTAQCGMDPVCGTVDCGSCDEGLVCSEGTCIPDPCAAMPFEGCCEDNVIKWCEAGVMQEADCSANEDPTMQTCGFDAENGWFDCGASDPIPDGVTAACPGSTPCETDAECDDGNLCTTNTCVAGSCATAPVCTGTDVCDPETGTCSACVPACDGLQCGDDGCGGVCGTCDEGQLCEAGMCVLDPCAAMPFEGCCEDNVVQWCENGVVQQADCAANEDPTMQTCGWDDANGWFDCGASDPIPDGITAMCPGSVPCESDAECDDGDLCTTDTCVEGMCVRAPVCTGTDTCNPATGECEACVPACDGLQCGDDGCEGVCGTCDEGFSCMEGLCVELTGYTCDAPGTLACGTAVSGDNSLGMNMMEGYSCSTFSYAGPEDVWQFVLDGDAAVTLTLSGMTADLDLYVLDAACDADACVVHSAGTSDEVIELELTAGTYHVVIEGYSGATDTYNLALDCGAPCVPDCSATECGMDPVCGTMDCGTCSDGDMCVEGVCMADPCEGIGATPDTRCCVGDVLLNCADATFEGVNCADDGSVCGYFPGNDSFAPGFYCGPADMMEEPPAGVGDNCSVIDTFECATTCADEGLACDLHPTCPWIDCGACADGFACDAGQCIEVGGLCDTVDETLTCENNVVSGNNAANGALSLGDGYSCTNYDQSGPEYVYSFTAPVAGDYAFALDGLGCDVELLILTDACDPLSCVQYIDATGTATLDAGAMYYIAIDGYNGASCDYDLTMTCPAP